MQRPAKETGQIEKKQQARALTLGEHERLGFCLEALLRFTPAGTLEQAALSNKGMKDMLRDALDCPLLEELDDGFFKSRTLTT